MTSVFADAVAFHFVQTVQKMLGTNVQIAVKSWVSINVQLLNLAEVVVPLELGTTEAMHMAQQIVMCRQQRPCQMTKVKLENKHSQGPICQDCLEMWSSSLSFIMQTAIHIS